MPENIYVEKLPWRKIMDTGLRSHNEVHIWCSHWDQISGQIEGFKGILSVDEIARTEKFSFEKDRLRFIMSRGVLRMILGHYLEMKPQQIRFDYTAFGKPIIAAGSDGQRINFNLAHSGELALYALTLNRRVGIDVELIQPQMDIWPIAERLFTDAEKMSLQTTDIIKRSGLFFNYWTRKEAIIKALGEGFSFPIEQVDVSKLENDFFSLIKSHSEDKHNTRWYVQDLFPRDGYAAAIAIESNEADLSFSYYSYEG